MKELSLMRYYAQAPISLKQFSLKRVNIRFIDIAFVVTLSFWKPINATPDDLEETKLGVQDGYNMLFNFLYS